MAGRHPLGQPAGLTKWMQVDRKLVELSGDWLLNPRFALEVSSAGQASAGIDWFAGLTSLCSTDAKTLKYRFTLHAFQGKHVAMYNPVRRVYRLPVATIWTMHGHPSSRE
jgi:hypothetical protein